MDDLFAIGSLLYEILSGRRPYADLNSMDVEERYKLRNFPSTDDVELYGYASISQSVGMNAIRISVN